MPGVVTRQLRRPPTIVITIIAFIAQATERTPPPKHCTRKRLTGTTRENLQLALTSWPGLFKPIQRMRRFVLT